MRVPALVAQSVEAQVPYGSTAPNLQQPDIRGAQALAQVAGDVNKLGATFASAEASKNEEQKRALAAAEKAKKEADGLIIDGAVVEAQQRANSQEAAFRQKTGRQALEGSGPALDDFDKIITDGEEQFTDQQLRAQYRVKAQAALLSQRKGIESHTSQQFLVDQKETLEGMRAGAIQAAGRGDLTPEQLALQVQVVDDSFDKQLSPEAAKAAKSELRGDMAFEVISAQIAAGNLEGATENITDMGYLLGPKRVEHLQGAMAQQKNTEGIKKARVEISSTVSTIITSNRGDDGFVDETKAEADLEAMPESDTKEKARQLLATRLNQEAAAKTRQVLDWKHGARAQFNVGGYAAIDAKLITKLQKYDPDYLGALSDKQDQKNARELAKRTGQVKKQNAVERRADRHWLKVFKAMPAEERATLDVEDWAIGKGMSENGEDDLNIASRKSKEYKEKGFSGAEDRFTTLAEQMSKPLFMGRKAPLRGQDDKRAEYRAEASDVFDAFVQREKRTPTKEEATAEIAKLMARTTLVSHWWRPDEVGYEFEKRAKAPDAEKPKPAGVPTKLKPGRYESKSKPGTFFRVDEKGMKTPE